MGGNKRILLLKNMIIRLNDKFHTKVLRFVRFLLAISENKVSLCYNHY